VDRKECRTNRVVNYRTEDAAAKAKEADQQSGEQHKDGGFLKRAWDKLTHHDEAPNEDHNNNDKKKASGSGS
jgi:hypothetical protein